MKMRLASLMRRLRDASRREDGTATLDFVMMVPIFVGLFVSSFELSIIMTRQMMLERGLDLVGTGVEASDLRQRQRELEPSRSGPVQRGRRTAQQVDRRVAARPASHEERPRRRQQQARDASNHGCRATGLVGR